MNFKTLFPLFLILTILFVSYSCTENSSNQQDEVMQSQMISSEPAEPSKGVNSERSIASLVDDKGTNSTSTVADCHSIEKMITEYRSNQIKTSLANKAMKAAIKKLLGKVIGTLSGTALTELLNPTTANPPYSLLYKKTMYSLYEEYKKETPDVQKLESLIKSLKINAQSSRIEEDFGDNTNCYDLMDEGVNLAIENLKAYQQMLDQKF